jgi:heterotetrameric sarcosine oxidase alpha subunit
MSAFTLDSREQPNRLAKGGLIDRSKAVAFSFDGRRYAGYSGDTLASALLAAGVRRVGRSFKYHRPRGIFAAGFEEPNALVELRTGARREPNTRATAVELFEGLVARSQNRWPSVDWDIGALASLLSPVFVAGFYYKTFMWPAAFWERVYEPAIRRAAGLGRASAEPDPDSYEQSHAFCDVLVIGAGPAGLTAALHAGRAGARVILCEEDFVLGGRLNSDDRFVDGRKGIAWAREVEAELLSLPEVRILRRTSVFGAYDGRTYAAVERASDHLAAPLPHEPRQRLWKIVAKETVLASGAIERPIVFGGNDRPGVMMASAARTYVSRYGVRPGRRVLVFTSADSGWESAFAFAEAGIEVEAVVDVRTEVSTQLAGTANRIGIRALLGAVVTGTRGFRELSEVTVREHSGRLTRLPAATLAVCGGWNPNIALTTHLGARPVWSNGISAFVPHTGRHTMTAVGAAKGSFLLSEALREGSLAGARAAEMAGFRPPSPPIYKADEEHVDGAPFWSVPEPQGKAFVDLQNDVTREDVALAAREGYRSVELLKRYTTLGMGTDQGKTSNVNGLAMLAELTGHSIPEVGTTVFRPPYAPVALGVLAGHRRGRDLSPTRYTAGHDWAEEKGASFVEAGQWLRAQWFTAPGDADWFASVCREVTAVRSRVGVCDVSTLGKIDIQGADAGLFLDRVYTNVMSTLAAGKTRYGLMLREDGMVLDDGTVARLGPDHFIASTTTANAAKVMQHLEHARQVLWPQLDLQIVSVTEQWAQYSLAGPDARRVLERLLDGALDVSDTMFPYMACAEFRWHGIPARLFRVSFSGELAYELAVPARYGDACIRAIMMAGEEWAITPYGTEALGVMRIEKGHAAGNELNGTTTAADLGLGRMMSTKKDFIGRVLAGRPGLTDPRRPTLVGLRPLDATTRLRAGAHLLTRGAPATAENDEGYLTSVAYSPMLKSWIGLGLLSRGPERMGERVRAYDPLRGGDAEVEVVPPVFFDPDGARLRG